MENFIVSARKYRPSTFRSVVGQNHITSTLRNAISRGQLAHAYLFCGPRGVGKTTCARIFAKAINCTDPQENEACGKCESCLSFEQGRSFNIHELDAASNNSVEDIRSLTDQVRIPPQVGRYSVYIIDEVHMLSSAAFNAFLKTLEEPPAHAVFILATTEKHKIIPTILSRCQIFDFNRIKVSDGVDYMRYIADTEGVKYDEESLNLIARKADGGMRDALSMFDKAVSFCGPDLKYKDVAASLNILDYDTYFDAVETILAGDYGAALVMFDGVLAQGFSGQTFMSGLSSHLRDLLVAKNPKTAELLDVTGPLMERYKTQAVKCDPGFLFAGIALLTELDAKIRVATNQRLTVELALMKLCNLVSTPETSPESGAKKKYDDDIDLPPLKGTKQPETKPEPKPEPESESEPVVEKPKPATAPKSSTSISASISGRSLSDIMAGGTGYDAGTEKNADTAQSATPVDPAAQEKIERHRDKFIEKLTHESPRIGVVYETMEVGGNRVSVRVASEDLSGEVLRRRTETLQLLAAVAGVYGPIELDVVVDETIRPAKPIRLEDKLRHLTELNSELETLRKALDLEVE